MPEILLSLHPVHSLTLNTSGGVGVTFGADFNEMLHIYGLCSEIELMRMNIYKRNG